MMHVLDGVQLLARNVCRVLLAIGDGKVLALDVSIILAYYKL
jgi:hypothetical protein